MRNIWLGMGICAVISAAAAAQSGGAAAPAMAALMPRSGVVQIYGGGGSETVGPGDLLDVRIFDQPQLSGETRVSPDGHIQLPFLAPVEVAGETVGHIQSLLAQRYTQVLLHPLVSVMLIEVNSRKISVLGEVPRPGVYAYSGQVTLLEAIGMAGGLIPEYADNHVYLLHSPPATRSRTGGGQPAFHINSVLETINLSRIAEQPGLNRVLLPGDVIEVPRLHRVFLTGAVKSVGALPLRAGMTLNEAISEAGGYSGEAAASDVRILRLIPGQTGRRELVVNGNAIRKNRTPDVKLHADDIIVVPTSGVRRVGLAVLSFFGGAGRWWVDSKTLHVVHMY